MWDISFHVAVPYPAAPRPQDSVVYVFRIFLQCTVSYLSERCLWQENTPSLEYAPEVRRGGISVSSWYLLVGLGEAGLLRLLFSKEEKSQRKSLWSPVSSATTGPENHSHARRRPPVSQCEPLKGIKHGSLDSMMFWHRRVYTWLCLYLVQMATCRPLC